MDLSFTYIFLFLRTNFINAQCICKIDHKFYSVMGNLHTSVRHNTCVTSNPIDNYVEVKSLLMCNSGCPAFYIPPSFIAIGSIVYACKSK